MLFFLSLILVRFILLFSLKLKWFKFLKFTFDKILISDAISELIGKDSSFDKIQKQIDKLHEKSSKTKEENNELKNKLDELERKYPDIDYYKNND